MSSKVEFQLDDVRATAYEELEDTFGEDVAKSLVRDQLEDAIIRVYDERYRIAERMEESE